ncbi:MAG: Sapep family Mn(2+)-dependent dipeptidase [Bacillota bacterium]
MQNKKTMPIENRTFAVGNESDMIDFLSEIIACETVLSAPLEGAPFGSENLRCLKAYLDKAESFGFETKIVDGFAGHVEWKCGKKDAPLFGVLGHLDVVPAGEGWDTPPFQLTIKDGKFFGRGVQDDKGPMVIALYALKQMKDSGFAPNKDIRLIVGCNEENGSSCVEHYFTKERMPDVAISPDSDFPAIHSEKGIVWVSCDMDLNLAGFEAISGGEKMNMVPQKTSAVYCGDIESFEFEDCDIQAKDSGDKIILTSHGVNAHGSMPEMGENSISKLIFALHTLLYESADSTAKAGLDFLAKVAEDTNGKAVGIFSRDDVSGELTHNLGTISYKKGKLNFGLDIRYPNNTSVEKILDKLAKVAPKGSVFSIINSQNKLFVSPKDPLVKLCVESYNSFTGENAKSKKIGGGTYARELKYGVAVGPVFDGVPTTIHNKNEHMTEWEFFMSGEIILDIMKKISGESFNFGK